MFSILRIFIFICAFFLSCGGLAHASGPAAAKVELQIDLSKDAFIGGDAVVSVPPVLPAHAAAGFLDSQVSGAPAKPPSAAVLPGTEDRDVALPEPQSDMPPMSMLMSMDGGKDMPRLGREADLKRRDYSVDIAGGCNEASSRQACWEATLTYSRAGRDERSVMLTFVITTL